jgi:WD40 repeat protein
MAAFSPDGKRVVTASEDQTALVWETETGHLLSGPLAHRGTVWAAAFNPDGTRVVTASLDGTARVWDFLRSHSALDDWDRIAERSPFILKGIVLVLRSPRGAPLDARAKDVPP